MCVCKNKIYLQHFESLEENIQNITVLALCVIKIFVFVSYSCKFSCVCVVCVYKSYFINQKKGSTFVICTAYYKANENYYCNTQKLGEKSIHHNIV